MSRTFRRIIQIVVIAFWASAVSAQNDQFHRGPVIGEFGKIATIDTDMAIPENTRFKVVFDASKKAEAGQINQTINSVARFINMHVEAGVLPENIDIAIVTHGGASGDLTQSEFYQSKNGKIKNLTAAAIQTLLKHRVEIYLCGQSATAHGIAKKDLLPGVKMALSAMTAHALLQQKGYTLNPF